MSKEELLSRLAGEGRPIVADGAMGTLLHARGISLEDCFDALNLTQPALVADIHREYIEAGAELIETNTFGANAFKLAQHGLEDQTNAINTAGVELAKRVIDASFKSVLLAGSVGPLGVRLAPFGRVKPDQARAVYRDQIEALVEAGVDLLILETQNDLYELREAISAAREFDEFPIIASLTFTRDDRTLLGDSPTQVAEMLADMRVDMIGANCSGGPAQLLRILRSMRQSQPSIHFSIMPNAGWPERVSGRIMYPATEEYFSEYAQAFCEAGATLIGGCCGTTPAHIAAIRTALESDDPPCLPTDPESSGYTVAEVVQKEQEPTQFEKTLTAGKFTISVEVDPPKGYSPHKLLAGAHLLAEAGADVINVADSPMARMRMSPWAVCQLIQREVELDTVLHFPTRGRNLLRVQGDLLASHAVGVRNIFVVMGDPTAVGDYPEAMDDYDLVPSGLVKLIKHNFNSGVDHSGADIGAATSFFVGCALNLCARDPERELQVLKRKIDAGSDFALTQPVFETHLARQFLEDFEQRYGKLNLPILVGVLPIYGSRHASFLHNEVPGIAIPTSIQQRIERAGDKAPEEGVRIAVELLSELQSLVQGAYLMPPFGRYDIAAEIIEQISPH